MPQQYVPGGASDATLCSGHVIKIFPCLSLTVEKGIWIHIQAGLDTSQIQIQCACLHCIWKRVPAGPPPPLRGNTLPLCKKAPDMFKFLRDVMGAILSARPKCSHRCVSRKETPLKRVEILTHATRRSTEQTSMRTKWFKHIAI